MRRFDCRRLERRDRSQFHRHLPDGASTWLSAAAEIYTGTKGAVVAMTRDLAAELAPRGVRVNAVAPDWTDTEMNAALLNHPAAPQKVLERVPLGRWGTAEDVAGPVLSLAHQTRRDTLPGSCCQSLMFCLSI